ncbi:MAG: hypothetical protein ACF788_08190 [Novipirellula sp. JB048]
MRFGFVAASLLLTCVVTGAESAPTTAVRQQVDRSPVDLAINPSGAWPAGRWIVTANETSGTVSLTSTASNTVVDEVVCGDHPADVIFSSDGALL